MEITIIWRFIVGIDISKDTLDLHVFDRKTETEYGCQVANTQQGFQHIDQWLESHGATPHQTRLISEHTGRYGEHLLRWTSETGWPHAVVSTTALEKVRWEHHRKTDAFDAKQLAEYGERFSDRIASSRAPSPVVSQLRRLQAERRAMVTRRGALKTKLGEASAHDADMERITDMWRQQIVLLDEHISELEQRITQQVSNSSNLDQRYKTMRTAPGMGPVLTPLWLSLHAGQATLYPRKVSSRFGFAPHAYSSGSSVRKKAKSSGHGNSEVRRVLHQAALSVKTHCPHYQAYYNQKKKEGKPHLLIINNIINKLIRLYCAMWNNRAEYDPTHLQKAEKKFSKSAIST